MVSASFSYFNLVMINSTRNSGAYLEHRKANVGAYKRTRIELVTVRER